MIQRGLSSSKVVSIFVISGFALILAGVLILFSGLKFAPSEIAKLNISMSQFLILEIGLVVTVLGVFLESLAVLQKKPIATILLNSSRADESVLEPEAKKSSEKKRIHSNPPGAVEHEPKDDFDAAFEAVLLSNSEKSNLDELRRKLK